MVVRTCSEQRSTLTEELKKGRVIGLYGGVNRSLVSRSVSRLHRASRGVDSNLSMPGHASSFEAKLRDAQGCGGKRIA